MIYGIGIDVLSLERLKGLDGYWDDPFFRRIFTEKERHEALGKTETLVYFAGRFAIKEAVVKALNGKGVVVEFPDIETLSNEYGAPIVKLVGKSARALDESIHIHASLSHEDDVCTAMVVVEANNVNGSA